MTQKQREKLTFIVGRLEGIAYGVDNENICDGIMKCSEEINEILAEDNRKPATVSTVEATPERCCKTCKHESRLPGVYPCSDCWFGDGSDDRIVYWEKKENSDAKAD